MQARHRRRLGLALVSALIPLAFVLGVEGWVAASAGSRIVNVEAAPHRECALVLGAPPGALLEARMDAACQLVDNGIVRSLILSGLPLEMPTMLARARACLNEDRIVVDDGASRTLASLVRARDTLGVRRGLLVSQAYHLPRALALADAVGFEAVGVVAKGQPSVRGAVRERLATLRAALDVRLLPRGP